MDKKIELFKLLSKEFVKRGFSLYLVGGTVRDYLLGVPLSDMDLVTDATPMEMRMFLDADYTFEKYGSVKYFYEGVKFDITTLRIECNYSDSRHPKRVCFTKSLKDDVFRRDLTINALYMDKDLNVIDFVGGLADLKNKIINMVGDPLKRISEDPLRIIRAYRFMLEFNFDIEPKLDEVMKENISLVKKLNIDKVRQEIKKSSHQNELISLLNKIGFIVDIK